MKALLLLAALTTQTAHYSARGVAVLPTGLRSCGAEERLLTDTFRVELHEDYVTVNGTPWGIASGYSDLTLTYFADPRAFMYMTMTIRGTSGELRMDGITAARVPCADRVLLRVR